MIYFLLLAYHPITICRPPRAPISAFIVEDMMEFVRAHATYRFVLLDDEEERPKVLVMTIILL